MATFTFTAGRTPQYSVLDMALEARFKDGKVVQSMFAYAKRGNATIRVLVYREGVTGKWLITEGISFNGLPRTPENLIKSLGYAEPYDEVYVLPAV